MILQQGVHTSSIKFTDPGLHLTTFFDLSWPLWPATSLSFGQFKMWSNSKMYSPPSRPATAVHCTRLLFTTVLMLTLCLQTDHQLSDEVCQTNSDRLSWLLWLGRVLDQELRGCFWFARLHLSRNKSVAHTDSRFHLLAAAERFSATKQMPVQTFAG